ncbi:MAG: thiamine-phosphate kinase, partial [Actinomycetota bacterium]
MAKDLTDVGEFGLIRALLERLPTSDLIVPPGDDAAVMRVPEQLVVTTDLLVEGRHFDLAFSSPADVGYKALTVNVSDIAAMGGRPLYALIALGAPSATLVTVMEELYDGVSEAARAHGVTVAGGDTVGADQLIVSVALLGEAGEGGIVRRKGARPGDLLCVTGELGGASAGLALLRAASGDPAARALLDRHPHLAEAHRRGRARDREGLAAGKGGA